MAWWLTVGIAGVLSLAGYGWLLPQTTQTPPPAAAGDRVTVTPAGDTAVLLDPARGKTWALERRPGGGSAWLPVPRIDTDAEAERWRASARRAAGGAVPGLEDALAARGYVRVPMERTRAGYLTARATLNGHPLCLAIDTGAPNTHFDRKRVAALKLKWEEPDADAGHRADGGTAPVCEVTDLRIGALKARPLTVGAHDLSALNHKLREYRDPPFDGLLGTDLLDHHLAVIDYMGLGLYLLKRGGDE